MTIDLRLLRRAPACTAALSLLLLAACASPPPPRLYQLRAAEPADAAAPAATAVWVVGPVSVPEYLDRPTLLRRQGQAGLQPLEGHRWAEPLADAVPRVLRQALAARWGVGQVWAPPLPPGVRAARQLRVEVLRFDADEAALVLQARWAALAPAGDAPPRTGLETIRVPLPGPEPDALAAAHAVAVQRLAGAIAEALR